jgi:hypothetical protein
MNDLLKIRNAAIVGVVPALLEGLLIYSVEPQTSLWVIARSVLAWFGFGFVVYLIDKGQKVMLHSVLLTVLLCLPWYIAETVGTGTPEHLAPLVVASVVMGAIIGLVCRRLSLKV